MDSVKEKLVELINAIDGVCPKDASCYDCEYKDVTHCAIPAKADFLIANGVTFATDNNVGDKWISVKDRLPDRDGWYLVMIKWADEATTLYFSDDYWRDIEDEIYSVTHWMPLPMPPKGE